MGSILSAINDDENEFEDFLRMSNLNGKYSDSPYSEYSRKLRHLYKEHNGKLKGRLLLAAVSADFLRENQIDSANLRYNNTIAGLLVAAQTVENTDLK